MTAPHDYSKADLRRIYSSLARLLPPGGRPLSAEEIVEVNDLLSKTTKLIDTARTTVERGELVFSWRIPRDQAPTLNAYAQMKGWQKKRRRRELDEAIVALLPAFPKALLHGAQTKRWVRVTRFSPKRVDEVSVDILGGKLPVDALVRCGILADDNEALLHREPRAEKTRPGNTHVLVEVFLIASEGVETDEPRDVGVDLFKRDVGFLTKAIIGDAR